MEKSSFGNKLLLWVIGTTFVVFSLTMFLISKFSYDIAQKDTELYIHEVGEKYASKIQSSINQSIVVSKSMASKFEVALNSNIKLDEQETISYFKSLLKNNRAFRKNLISSKCKPIGLLNVK